MSTGSEITERSPIGEAKVERLRHLRDYLASLGVGVRKFDPVVASEAMPIDTGGWWASPDPKVVNLMSYKCAGQEERIMLNFGQREGVANIGVVLLEGRGVDTEILDELEAFGVLDIRTGYDKKIGVAQVVVEGAYDNLILRPSGFVHESVPWWTTLWRVS